MNTTWPLSGITLVCTECKNALHEADGHLVCGTCGLEYARENGVASMLIDRPVAEKLAEGAARKEAIIGMFDSINRSLEEKRLSRFSTFINWGYAAPENEPSGGLLGINQSSIRLLREIIGGLDISGRDILEIGCGRGGNVNELCKSYGAGSVVGIDLTPSNIYFCQGNNRYEQAYYCIGDAEQLPVRTESCDYVLNVESSHLYPHIELFFDETYRVLKPGGTFMYADIMSASDLPRYEAQWQKLGFRTAFIRDITGNILQSGDESLGSRRQALEGSFEGDKRVMEWLEAPGTQNHTDMIAGRRVFKIIHLVKDAVGIEGAASHG
ncbi:class I SAM-dependent methyltransferase [Paenibacillus durus]|uniref:class I SAM-dependent methyltransferase n=1 Tax=Paenibacillus durus TaxID=44251 RepID=UPI00069486CB|nr:class I SAM-dependent methyltransferase [Paenibacillus durus]